MTLTCSILPTDDETALVAVLNLGHFFQVPAAQADARRALEGLPVFRAALRYRLGLKNMIVDWVSSGYRELVLGSLREISAEDIMAMGVAAYHAVVVTKFDIEAHRKYLAYDPPCAQHVPTCYSTMECDRGWAWHWKRKVTPYFMHPEEWFSGASLLDKLYTVELNDMNQDCLRRTLDWVRDNGAMTKEDVMITESIRSLTV